jgi:hypothetical protein
MKAAQHRNSDDLAIVVVVCRAVRDPLLNTLMRPGFVEVEHVLPSDVFQLLLAEEEYVVESLAPQAADKPFGNGIHVRGPHGGLDHPCADALGNAVELGAELLVSVSNQESRREPSMVALRNCCAVHCWVGFLVAAMWTTLREPWFIRKKGKAV